MSISLKEYANIYENNFDSATVSIFDAAGGKFGKLGGLNWAGDDDNEIIFGSSWLDRLRGNAGDDEISGFEEDDYIHGGAGDDRLFGDSGDDEIHSGATTLLDFLSGGSGNDELYGAAGV